MIWVHAERAAPRSYAFFCPVCGDTWASCAVRHQQTGQIELFTVWEVPCKYHYTDSQRVPGSLWLQWDKDFTDSFPPDLMKWELERHLDFIERRLQDAPQT